MGLSLPGRNTDFDALTEQSSDGEKLDVVFRLLRKSQTPIWMPYHQLKIKNKDEALFNAKLKATGFVETQNRNGAYHPAFKLNDAGYLMLETYENYLSYLQWEANKRNEAETENLSGSFKNDQSLAIKIEHIGDQYHNYGNNGIVGNTISMDDAPHSKPENEALVVAQLKNTELSSQLYELQIREAKNKKVYAILGAIGGGAITYFFSLLSG